MAVGFGEVC